MKKFIHQILFFLMFTLFLTLKLNGQTYSNREKVVELGTWTDKMIDKSMTANANIISISSYVTKQNILTYANYDIKRKTVSELPKYRYELMLVSKSTQNYVPVKTWIQNAKVFINDVEVTREQFPNGFSSVIKIKPTLVYWYETSSDTVNIKISWEGSNVIKN